MGNSFTLKLPMDALDSALDPSQPGAQIQIPYAPGQAPGQSAPPSMQGALPPIPSTSQQAAPAGPPGSSDYAAQKLAADTASYKPFSQEGVLGKIGRVAGYALGAAQPRIASEIPSTPLGHIAQLNADTTQLRGAQQEERQQAQERTQEESVAQRPELAAAQAEARLAEAELHGQSAEQVAQTRAGAQEQVAQTNAGSREQVAQTNQTGAVNREQMHDTTMEDIAKGKNITAENVAKINRETGGTLQWGQLNGMPVLYNNKTGAIAYGATQGGLAPKPGQIEERMGKMATYTTGLIDDAEKMVHDAEDQLGPGAGRWNEFATGKLGLKNVDYTSVMSQLDFVASAITLAHSQGRISGQMYDNFQKLYSNAAQDPDNIIAALEIGKKAMGAVNATMTGQTSGGQSPTAQAPSGQAAPWDGFSKWQAEQNKKGAK